MSHFGRTPPQNKEGQEHPLRVVSFPCSPLHARRVVVVLGRRRAAQRRARGRQRAPGLFDGAEDLHRLRLPRGSLLQAGP